MASRTHGKPRALGWVALVGVSCALAFPALALAAYPGANGRIALTVQTWRPPPPPEPIPPEFPHPGLPIEPILVSATIVSVAPDARGRRLLHTASLEHGGFYYGDSSTRPTYSPNGKLIAFDEGNRLHIMRQDGTGLRVLPALSNGDTAPAWSPNGRRLVFFGQRPCPLYCGTLYTVRPDSTGLRQVGAYEGQRPAWSTKGRIAFLNNDDQYRTTIAPPDGLYSVRPDGSRLRRLFGGFVALGNEPDWSPDGRRLAFRARGRIVTMNPDGSGRRAITEAGRNFSHPTWSPDGRYIAVIGGAIETDDHGVYIMRPNGRGLRRVVAAGRTMSSDGEIVEWETFGPPSWQPLRR